MDHSELDIATHGIRYTLNELEDDLKELACYWGVELGKDNQDKLIASSRVLPWQINAILIQTVHCRDLARQLIQITNNTLAQIVEPE